MNENNMNSWENTAKASYHSSKPNFCTNCGSQIPQMQNFCTVCGQPVQFGGSQTQPPISINKKTFIEKYAPERIRKDIKGLSIFLYVLVAVNVLVALVSATLGSVPISSEILLLIIFESVLLVGLTVAMQLTKNKIFAILLLVFSCVEMAIGLAMSGRPSSYFWLFVSIGAVSVFRKADKLYKEFIVQNSPSSGEGVNGQFFDNRQN